MQEDCYISISEAEIIELLTSSGELSPLLLNGLLNHWEKSSDELNMLGSKKLSKAHSSSRLFCKHDKESSYH